MKTEITSKDYQQLYRVMLDTWKAVPFTVRHRCEWSMSRDTFRGFIPDDDASKSYSLLGRPVVLNNEMPFGKMEFCEVVHS